MRSPRLPLFAFLLSLLINSPRAMAQEATRPEPVKLRNPSWSPDGRFLVASDFVPPLEEGYNSTLGQTVSVASTLRVWSRENGQWLAPPWKKEPIVTTITAPVPGIQGSVSYDSNYAPGADISSWRWTPDSQNLITDRQDHIGHQLEQWHWAPELNENAQVLSPPTLTPNIDTQRLASHEQAFVKSLTNLRGETRALETSPDNRTVAIGTVNEGARFASAQAAPPKGSLALWDIQSATLTHLEDGPDVAWLSFSTSGRWLAVGESYNTSSLDIWDVNTHKKVASQNVRGKVAVGWLDDRNFLFTERVKSTDGKITHVLKKWNGRTTSAMPVAVSSVPGKQGLGISEEALDIHGGLLLSRDDKQYHWYTLPALKEVCTLPLASNAFPVLSPDATIAAVETPEGRIELWHPAHDGQQAQLAGTLALLSSSVGQSPTWILWTPDGFYDCSPDASQWITGKEDGRLLLSNVSALHRHPGLLREIAPMGANVH